METIKNLAVIISATIGGITLFGVIFRPTRNLLANIINKWTGTNDQNNKLQTIEEKIDALISNNTSSNEIIKIHSEIHLTTIENRITNLYYKYLDEEFIPEFESSLLIKQYELYHKLGGNGKMTKMYEDLMKKKIRQVNI